MCSLCGWLIATLAGLVLWGGDYYLTSFSERAFHAQHRLLRPSGALGHTLGIAGTGMMLLSFVYSLRKRWTFLQRFGTQKQWLQFHIFLGLGGPLLVTFHTSGKLIGIAAIAFYSMMAMVSSGIIGRYLYSKIPRTRKGSEMSLAQIEQQLDALISQLGAEEARTAFLEAVEGFLSQVKRQRRNLLITIYSTVFDDLRTPVRFISAWRIARIRSVSSSSQLKLARLIMKQRRLLKKLAILEASQRLFCFWHVFHKPFTVLSTVVILLHVAVTIYFGYGVAW